MNHIIPANPGTVLERLNEMKVPPVASVTHPEVRQDLTNALQAFVIRGGLLRVDDIDGGALCVSVVEARNTLHSETNSCGVTQSIIETTKVETHRVYVRTI